MVRFDVRNGDSTQISSVLNDHIRECQFFFVEKPTNFWTRRSKQNTIENCTCTFWRPNIRKYFQKFWSITPRVFCIFVLWNFVCQLIYLLKLGGLKKRKTGKPWLGEIVEEQDGRGHHFAGCQVEVNHMNELDNHSSLIKFSEEKTRIP